MTRAIFRGNGDFKFAQALNAAETYTDAAQQEIESQSDYSPYLLQVKTSIDRANYIVSKNDNWIKRLFRTIIKKVFGHVTQFEQAKEQVSYLSAKLEYLEEIHSSKMPETKKNLGAAKAKLEQARESLVGDMPKINFALETVSKHLEAIKARIKPGISPEEAMALKQEADILKISLMYYEVLIERLADLYTGQKDMAPVEDCLLKYQTVNRRLFMLSTLLSDLQIPQKVRTKRKNKVVHGGIRNGGNSCFLSSALQVISGAPQLRALFKTGNTPIHRLGNGILTKLEKGKTVSRGQINAFRDACLHVGIVQTSRGPEDAQETLGRLIEFLGDSLEIRWIRSETLTNLEASTRVRATQASDFGLSMADDLATGGTDKQCIELSPFAGLSQAELFHSGRREKIRVDMQEMINTFWAPEYISETHTLEVDVEGNSYKRTSDSIREKRPVLDSFPAVITINVRQVPGIVATPTGVETVYPAGVDADGNGIGPAYDCVGGIEHRPGHYIACTVAQGQVFQANDSIVSKKRNLEFPGCGYIYVRRAAP